MKKDIKYLIMTYIQTNITTKLGKNKKMKKNSTKNL